MTFRIYSIAEIRGIPIGQLREFAREIGVRGPTTMTKEALENAVYMRLKEIEQSRKVPSELLSPKSRVEVLDKGRVTDGDRELFGPFTTFDKGLSDFSGIFRPYDGGDGLICKKLLPSRDDIFVTQGFVDSAQLVCGDSVTGKYAVSEESGLKMLAVIGTVNKKLLTERRAASIDCRERLLASKPLELWDDASDIRALALAAPLKNGARVLLSHGGHTSLENYNVRLGKALKRIGVEVISLFLGVAPERARMVEESGAFVCPFDVEDKYVNNAVELAIESAYRGAEEGRDIALIIDNAEVCSDSALMRKVLGCACNLGDGSVTVFVTANADIMENRTFGILSSAADICVRLESNENGLTVDFERCSVKTDYATYPLLASLKKMNGEVANTIIANCATKEDAEKLLQ